MNRKLCTNYAVKVTPETIKARAIDFPINQVHRYQNADLSDNNTLRRICNEILREINTVISRRAVTIIRTKRPVEIFRSHQSALLCISKEGEKEIGVDSSRSCCRPCASTGTYAERSPKDPLREADT